jgi:hypothetical protein
MRTVSIHQPGYLPSPIVLQRILRSDIHVILNHVQFEKGSYINRNKIWMNGGPKWMTIPVNVHLGDSIHDVKVNGNDWIDSHKSMLRSSYLDKDRIKYACRFLDMMREHEYVSDIARLSMEFLAGRCLPMIVESIDMPEAHGYRKSELVLKICQEVEATTYIAGPMSSHYLDMGLFRDAGIDVQIERPVDGLQLSAIHHFLTGEDICEDYF